MNNCRRISRGISGIYLSVFYQFRRSADRNARSAWPPPDVALGVRHYEEGPGVLKLSIFLAVKHRLALYPPLSFSRMLLFVI